MKIDQFFYEHPVFSYEEFVAWKAEQQTTNRTSVRMALFYYTKKSRLRRLRRELYAVVPPNISVEDFSVDPYLIAGKVTSDSILAYHTALELHGLAYSSFEQFTFVTNHKVKPFEIDGRWYRAVIPPKALKKPFKKDKKKVNYQHNELLGVETIDRQGVEIKVTNISRTFVDILDRIDLSGGLEEVCRSVENMVVLDVDMVIKYCLMLNNARLAAKVGYFLEQRKGAFAVTDKQLKVLLNAKPKSPQYISKTLSKALQSNCRLVKKWNLMLPKYILDRSWEEPYAEV